MDDEQLFYLTSLESRNEAKKHLVISGFLGAVRSIPFQYLQKNCRYDWKQRIGLLAMISKTIQRRLSNINESTMKCLSYYRQCSYNAKPRPVVEAVEKIHATHNTNIHRGVHTLAQEATDYMKRLALKSSEAHQCSQYQSAFTRGTTASLSTRLHKGFAPNRPRKETKFGLA